MSGGTRTYETEMPAFYNEKCCCWLRKNSIRCKILTFSVFIPLRFLLKFQPSKMFWFANLWNFSARYIKMKILARVFTGNEIPAETVIT